MRHLGLALLLAVFLGVRADFSGKISAVSSVSLRRMDDGCAVLTDSLKVRKQVDANDTIALVKFDLNELRNMPRKPDLAVLRLFPTDDPSQVLLGRVEVHVVLSNWSLSDVSCDKLPVVIDKYESPPRFIVGIAGEELTLNLETLIGEMLTDGLESLSLLLRPEDSSQSINLALQPVVFLVNDTDPHSPRIDYHVPSVSSDGVAEMKAAPESVVAGEVCRVTVLVPKLILNGSIEIYGNDLPEGALTVQVNQGNIDGPAIPATVSLGTPTTTHYSYVIAFTATAAGTARVAASLFEVPVVNSPQGVTVQPAKLSFAKSSSDITLGPLFFQPNGSVPVPAIDRTTCFTVLTRDEFDNRVSDPGHLTLAVVGDHSGDIKTTSHAVLRDGEEQFCFQPVAVETVEVAVSLDGSVLAGFPVRLSVQPGPINSTRVDASALVSAAPLRAGRIYSFRLYTVDSSGYTLDADILGFIVSFSGPGFVEYNVTNTSDAGVMEVSLTAHKAGNYSAACDYKGHAAAPVAFTIVAAEMNPNNTVVVFADQSVEAATVHTVRVVARDVYGNDQTTGGGLDAEVIIDPPADGVTPSFTIVDLNNGTYEIQWQSNRAGHYLIHIGTRDRDGNLTEIIHAPVAVYVQPGRANLDKTVILNPATSETVRAGDARTLIVQERDSYGNNRTHHDSSFALAAVVARKGDNVTHDAPVENDDDGSVRVEIGKYLTRPGTYHLTITVGLLVLAEVDYDVVAGYPSPRTSTLSRPDTAVGRVGVPLELLISLNDRFGNAVTAKYEADNIDVVVVHAGSYHLRGAVEHVDDNVYRATVVPRVVGEHQWFVSYRQIELDLSPFSVSIGPGPVSGRMSYALGQGLHTAVAGEREAFLVRARDQGANDLVTGGHSVEGYLQRHADHLSDSTDDFEVLVVDNGDGTYSCQYNVTQAGDYSLFVVVDKENILGSPFAVKVHPNVIGDFSVALTGAVVDQSPVAGTTFSVLFDSYDSFGNRRLVGGDNVVAAFTYLPDYNATTNKNVFKANVVDLANGTYKFTGHLIKAGDYFLNVTCEGRQFTMATAGFIFTVVPGPSSPSHATLEGRGISHALTGDETVIVLTLRDVFYNEAIAGGDNVSVTLVPNVPSPPSGAMASTVQIRVDVDDLGNGTYLLTYVPRLMGEYILSVKLEDKERHEMVDVFGSPSLVTVTHNRADATYSYVSVSMPVTTAGSPVVYTLRTRDRYNNTCAVGGVPVDLEVSSGTINETHTLVIKDHRNGLYSLRLKMLKSGVYSVHVTIDGDRIRMGNASRLVVQPGETHPLHTTIDVDGLDVLEAGQATSFAVLTRDEYNNLTPGTDGVVSVSVTTGSDHIVFGNFSKGIATIVATHAGHGNLSVQFNGREVLMSPHPVMVVGGATNALRSEVSGRGLVAAVAGTTAYFTVTPLDQFGNYPSHGEVEVRITDSHGERLSLDFDDPSKQRYVVAYTPTETGPHEINVTVDGQNVPGSPFNVVVRAGKTDASMCELIGSGVKRVRIGRPATFVIIARDGLGNLREVSGDAITVLAWSDERMDDARMVFPFDVMDLGIGMYRVSYIAPTHLGDFRLGVLINGDYAAGKNFTVEIAESTEVFSCPDDCSEHGVCDNSTGICVCESGWVGPSCADGHLPCPYNCSSHGQCDHAQGKCYCDPEYSGTFCQCRGFTCQVPVEQHPLKAAPKCLYDCSGHGVCVAKNTCVCDAGFYGAGCEARTRYSIVPLEAGAALLYESASGRLFGLRFRVTDDRSCAGVVTLSGHPLLFSTAFTQRPPFQQLVHVGDNKVVEIDTETGRTTLLSPKLSDLAEGVLTVSAHDLGTIAAFIGKDVVYAGSNRVLLTAGNETEEWAVDRQSLMFLKDHRETTEWETDDARLRQLTYVGQDLVVRYNGVGRYKLYPYQRATGEISVPAILEGHLTHIAEMGANNTLVLVPFVGDVWLAMNPRNADFRAFYCPIKDAHGFSGCTFLNTGNALTGFTCPAQLDLAERCSNMSVSSCLHSESCGYCVASRQCLPGTAYAPADGSCPSGSWVYRQFPFAYDYRYMAHNQLVQFEAATGKYKIWNVERSPRSDACPVLSDTIASGFIESALNQQHLFAGTTVFNFNPSTGDLTAGECDPDKAVAQFRLVCDRWGGVRSEGLVGSTLVVLSASPALLLQYYPTTGRYRIFRVATRGEYDMGHPLVSFPPVSSGVNDALVEADVAVMSPSIILARQSIAGVTRFLRLDAANKLAEIGIPLSAPIQVIQVDGIPTILEYRFAALGPDTLVSYTPFGHYQVLECFSHPIPQDIWNNNAPIACRVRGEGEAQAPLCNTRLSRDECTSHPSCGWCDVTSQCHVGYDGGVCSKSQENCPASDWHVAEKIAPVNNTLDDSVCAVSGSCKACVADSRCGWLENDKACVLGSAQGPSNTSHVVRNRETDWNFYYCKGADACSTHLECTSCVQTSYCGWCATCNRCMAATSYGTPLNDVCDATGTASPFVTHGSLVQCPANPLRARM